jgi:large subunit ribosomal protein L9
MSTKKNIDLLLLDNVYNLGIVGDVVSVKPGYARNYLVPTGLATVPTEGAKKRVAEKRAQVERELREQREQRERMIAKLEGQEITLQRSANEQGVLFGSVSQQDIAQALQEEGFDVTYRDVRIGDPLKQLDSYTVPVQLESDLRTEIKVWVVSDRPMDQLAEEGDANPALDQESGSPEAGVVGDPETLDEHADNKQAQVKGEME